METVSGRIGQALLNNIQKTLAEKEKSLKDLEVKIPKMLADLKRNLEMDEAKKKINR